MPVELESETSSPTTDASHLLNVWLGELTTLAASDTPKACSTPTSTAKTTSTTKTTSTSPRTPEATTMTTATAIRPRASTRSDESVVHHRRSLISLASPSAATEDDLDAILGELSVLESQFDAEIAHQKRTSVKPKRSLSTPDSKTSTSTTMTTTASSHSRCSSDSSSECQNGPNTDSGNVVRGGGKNGGDTDSAFCDNLSIFSSSSSSNQSNRVDTQGSPLTPVAPTVKRVSFDPELNSNGSSGSNSDKGSDKAEKIRIALEKMKEASIKKVFIKVFTADGSSKSLLVDETMTVAHVTRLLLEKNRVKLDTRWSLVELLPSLHMERVYEDDEHVVENCLMWTVDSQNTLWFVQRPEKFDIFRRPEHYLLPHRGGADPSPLESHARQELLEEYFSSPSVVSAPKVDGFLWLKAEGKKSWKKFFFVLRSSGLYYSPKTNTKSASVSVASTKELVCLATFDVNHVYYGSSATWRKKFKAPTDFGFAIKHPQIQVATGKQAVRHIRYVCASSESELHRWVSGVRLAKQGRKLYETFRSIEEEMAHHDIDLISSRLFSHERNSKKPAYRQPNHLQLPVTDNGGPNGNSEVGNINEGGTPVSCNENKSLDSGLSSTASGVCVSDAALSESDDNNASINTTRSETSQGFETDFPVGGTIKKRPALAPKLPLTHNTTWMMQQHVPLGKDGSDDIEVDRIDNREGDGQQEEDVDDHDEEMGMANVRIGGGGTLLRAPKLTQRIGAPQHEAVVQAQVHADDVVDGPHNEDAEDNEDVESLPPPPPPACMLLSRDSADLDLLPPPPPPMELTATLRVHKHPATESVRPLAEPPPAFLRDLQRVMKKKWQISEKCRVDSYSTPHQVLGFRDEQQHEHARYSKDESVGAWVLQSQPFQQHFRGGEQQAQQQPLPQTQQQLVQIQQQHAQNHQEQQPLYSVVRRGNVVVLKEPDQGQSHAYHQGLPMTGTKGRSKPPPPPRRSETTQLSSGSNIR